MLDVPDRAFVSQGRHVVPQSNHWGGEALELLRPLTRARGRRAMMHRSFRFSLGRTALEEVGAATTSSSSWPRSCRDKSQPFSTTGTPDRRPSLFRSDAGTNGSHPPPTPHRSCCLRPDPRVLFHGVATAVNLR